MKLPRLVLQNDGRRARSSTFQCRATLAAVLALLLCAPAIRAAESLVLRGHERWVAAVQFSPDGKRLVSGGEDESVKVWDARTGTLLWSVRENGSAVTAVAFSPDGKRVVAGRWDGVLKVRAAQDGRLLTTLRGHAENITAVVFSPDGKRIASGSGDDTLKIWDAESG